MDNFNNIILDYKQKFIQKVLMVNDTRIPKQVYAYIRAGMRNVGRPGQRWRNQPP